MSDTTENKKLIQSRLNRIIGRLNGVQGLLDSDEIGCSIWLKHDSFSSYYVCRVLVVCIIPKTI